MLLMWAVAFVVSVEGDGEFVVAAVVVGGGGTVEAAEEVAVVGIVAAEDEAPERDLKLEYCLSLDSGKVPLCSIYY